MNFGRLPSRSSSASRSSSRSIRMPSASMSIWTTSASYDEKVGTAPGYVGASAMITSPGSISVFVTRSITCCPPVVTIRWSGSTFIPPSACITSAMQSFVSASPSVGPYCSAFAHDSCAMRCATAANVSGGKLLVSGRPPASEITSGRAVTAIRSRIADDFMTCVREAKRPAYRSRSRLVERGRPRRGPSSTVTALQSTERSTAISLFLDIGQGTGSRPPAASGRSSRRSSPRRSLAPTSASTSPAATSRSSSRSRSSR